MYKLDLLGSNSPTKASNWDQRTNQESDPYLAYKKEVDYNVKKGRKFLEVDQVDLRALKNRLEVTSVCDLVGLYIGHEREYNLEAFKEKILKSLCSAERTEKMMRKLKLAKDLEVR